MLNKPQTPASINKTPTRTIGGCIWTVSDELSFSLTAVNIIPMPSPVRPTSMLRRIFRLKVSYYFSCRRLSCDSPSIPSPKDYGLTRKLRAAV
jgi:hypothetical protein